MHLQKVRKGKLLAPDHTAYVRGRIRMGTGVGVAPGPASSSLVFWDVMSLSGFGFGMRREDRKAEWGRGFW